MNRFLGEVWVNERGDLFLMHWPVPTLYDGDYVSTWKAMTELVKGGRLRTAGVSNFMPEHLDDQIDAAYRTKYRSHGGRYVNPMVAPTARGTTIKLVPRSNIA